MLSASTADPSMPDYTPVLTSAFAVLGLVYLAILVVMVIAYAKIIGKAGYNPWWVLMMFVPIGNIIVFLMFAFSEWPIQRRLRELEQSAGYGALPPSPPPYQPGVQAGTWSSPPAPAQPSPWAAPPTATDTNPYA
jgi:hypothetical protein